MYRSRASAILLALALAAPVQALAEPPRDTSEATARDLGDEALRRFQAGQWQAAYEMFQRADAAFHAPTLVLYMGHCQARLGNLPGAHRHYRAVLSERLGPGAPLQFRTAQDIAAEELRWVDQRLGVVSITVIGTPADRARISVDATEMAAPELEAVGLAPGEHVIEVAAPGAAPIRQTLTVAAGQRTKVAMDVTKLPSAPGATEPGSSPTRDAAAAPAQPPDAPPAPPESGSRVFVPAVALLGVGGAALLAGTVTGALSLHTANNVKSQCTPAGDCPTSAQGDATYAGKLAGASTGTFVVGGLALAAGVVLQVLHVKGRLAPGAAQVGFDVGHGALQGEF